MNITDGGRMGWFGRMTILFVGLILEESSFSWALSVAVSICLNENAILNNSVEECFRTSEQDSGGQR